ncbi:MAG TPA: hypothetical protein VD866_24045, partial [Urbifossiella sp.]|nr:hypothetical protein [Urbifossiella sp.]
AKRLARHAPAVSVAAVLSGSASARAPAVLAPSATIPPGVAALAGEVLGAMAGGKLMKAAAVVLLVGGVGFGVVLRAGQTTPVAPAAPPAPAVAAPGGENIRPTLEREAFTAWGKEAGGLQAGLEVRGRKSYRHGETVTLTVRVRNVGKEAVKFEYIRQYLDEHPPGVTGADGKAIPQATSDVLGVAHVPVEVSLEPGKDVVLGTRIHGTAGVPYELRPATGGGTPATRAHPLRVGTGKVALRYERVFGNSSIGSVKLDPAIAGLATGALEIEVTDAGEKGSLYVPTHGGMRELKGKEAAAYQTTNDWLAERLREANSIKVGSTYADVTRHFRTDGGLTAVGHSRMVMILCPYI